MTLIELKTHMMKVKFASIASLCRIFQTNPDYARCLLRHWIDKGKIRLCAPLNCAMKCNHCPATSAETYEWITS